MTWLAVEYRSYLPFDISAERSGTDCINEMKTRNSEKEQNTIYVKWKGEESWEHKSTGEMCLDFNFG